MIQGILECTPVVGFQPLEEGFQMGFLLGNQGSGVAAEAFIHGQGLFFPFYKYLSEGPDIKTARIGKLAEGRLAQYDAGFVILGQAFHSRCCIHRV